MDRIPNGGATTHPEEVGVRHGWATEQVVGVLRDATGPMSAAEVRSRVRARSGREIKHSTVRHILRYGTWATTNRILDVGDHRFRLA